MHGRYHGYVPEDVSLSIYKIWDATHAGPLRRTKNIALPYYITLYSEQVGLISVGS